MNKEKGITGLETAIILIAFIVVAAVFAYTVLSIPEPQESENVTQEVIFQIDVEDIIDSGQFISGNDTFMGTFTQTQNITLKYLDDGSGFPGLVVKWRTGAYFTNNGTWAPVEWIQRFEPWLNKQVNNVEYHVTWEPN